MRHLCLLIYVIGIFQSSLSFGQIGEPKTEFTGPPKMVEVEPSYIITTKNNDSYDLVPYRERRGSWGKTVSLSYSNYEPVNYQPNFLEVNFDEIYSQSEVPLLELQIVVKKNGSFASLGGELSIGLYQNDSDDGQLIESSLQLIPIRLGAIALLDSLRPNPYFVPYASGGAYTVIYKETNNSSSFSGNTQVAPYFNLGFAFSLDWIDKQASRIAYEHSGIEASYAFVEARSLFAAGDEQDPDFGNDMSFAGGLKIEF